MEVLPSLWKISDVGQRVRETRGEITRQVRALDEQYDGGASKTTWEILPVVAVPQGTDRG